MRRVLHHSANVRVVAEGGDYTAELMLHKSETSGTFQDTAWKATQAGCAAFLARHAGVLRARLEEVEHALLVLREDKEP